MRPSRLPARVHCPSAASAKNAQELARTKPGGELEPEVLVVSLDDINKKKQPDIALKPYDIIDVPDSNPWSMKNLPSTLLGLATGGAATIATNAPIRIIQ